MIEADMNHCRILKESIAGDRVVDEKTYTSLAILTERLERLKKLDKVFGKVDFSSDAKKLTRQRNSIAVS